VIAVDLFAGAGGFSTGAVAAGCTVAWAANHWPTAVQWHTANHPGTAHACQDLQQADFRDAPPHDILLASPACQGHSPARGKERPHHDAQRAAARAWRDAAYTGQLHRPTPGSFDPLELRAGLRVTNIEQRAGWVVSNPLYDQTGARRTHKECLTVARLAGSGSANGWAALPEARRSKHANA